MAKLKCDRHGRRVHVLKGPKVIHRSDGTVCNHSSLEIGHVKHVKPETVLFTVMSRRATNPKPWLGQS